MIYEFVYNLHQEKLLKILLQKVHKWFKISFWNRNNGEINYYTYRKYPLEV